MARAALGIALAIATPFVLIGAMILIPLWAWLPTFLLVWLGFHYWFSGRDIAAGLVELEDFVNMAPIDREEF